VGKKHQIVLVKWEDSANWRGWRNKEQLKDIKPTICYSSGILIKRTKQCIAVSHSVGDGDTGDTMVIPRKCVKDIKIISTFEEKV